MTYSRVVAVLLALSAVNLALMVPGGFVETRNFPAYPVAVLAAFNVFLTVLGLGSLILSWQVWRRQVVGWFAPAIGIAFAAVYLSDLFVIFPVSTTPMPPVLTALECVGTVLGVALIGFGWQAKKQTKAAQNGQPHVSVGAAILLAAVTIGIVVFATMAAK